MIIFKTIDTLQKELSKFNIANKPIGFAPTMGALHKGHISLIEAGKTNCDITVCSIFVNPTQFNDSGDFEKYPVTLENDILLLEKSGCDILFLPSVHEMYPAGLTNPIHYDLGFLEKVLEGSYRPGHFQGVCQVVHRLAGIVNPNRLFIGQKDYQQCMVIKRLLTLTGLQDIIQLIICPTLREESGLAMSSRNMRLNDGDRKRAAVIYQSLQFIKENIQHQEICSLLETAKQELLKAGFEKIDYIAIANADTLQPVDHYDNKTKSIALIAAFLNDVRLIDNMAIN